MTIAMTRSEFDKRMNLVYESIANELRNELVRTCPVDTGDLRSSIQVKWDGQSFVISMAEHGIYVEYGTPPHLIKASPGGSLRWKGDDGKTRHAKVVEHPGTRPNPFIRNAVRTQLPKIVKNSIQRHLL